MPTVLSSIQGGIYPLRKAQNYSSTHSPKSFLSVAFESVPTRVWFPVALSDPFKEYHRVLPLSVSLLQAINSAAESKRTKENRLHSSIHETTKDSVCKKKNPGKSTSQIKTYRKKPEVRFSKGATCANVNSTKSTCISYIVEFNFIYNFYTWLIVMFCLLMHCTNGTSPRQNPVYS